MLKEHKLQKSYFLTSAGIFYFLVLPVFSDSQMSSHKLEKRSIFIHLVFSFFIFAYIIVCKLFFLAFCVCVCNYCVESSDRSASGICTATVWTSERNQGLLSCFYLIFIGLALFSVYLEISRFGSSLSGSAVVAYIFYFNVLVFNYTS